MKRNESTYIHQSSTNQKTVMGKRCRSANEPNSSNSAQLKNELVYLHETNIKPHFEDCL